MGLAILARINQQVTTKIGDLKKYFRKEGGVFISDYLEEGLISFLSEDTRDGVISELASSLAMKGKLQDLGTFHAAIMEREKIVSTGIGIGVAIPHAKMEGYNDFFIAVGIQKKKGVDWNALDGSLVRLIFMIGGPSDRQTEYLRILSSLTQAIKDEERRKKILKTNSPREVIELFRGC